MSHHQIYSRILLVLVAVVAFVYAVFYFTTGNNSEENRVAQELKRYGVDEVHFVDSQPEEISFAATTSELSNGSLDACRSVTTVTLHGSNIDEAKLEFISELPNLSFLILATDSVSDEGLRHFDDHPSLEVIALYGARFSDACIDYLVAIPRLRSLDLGETRISTDGIDALRIARPNVDVLRQETDP